MKRSQEGLGVHGPLGHQLRRGEPANHQLLIRIWREAVGARGPQVAGLEQVHLLGAEAWCRPDRGQQAQAPGAQTGLLLQLAGGGRAGILARLEAPGGDLERAPQEGGPFLLHDQHASGLVHGQHGNGARMQDHVRGPAVAASPCASSLDQVENATLVQEAVILGAIHCVARSLLGSGSHAVGKVRCAGSRAARGSLGGRAHSLSWAARWPGARGP